MSVERIPFTGHYPGCPLAPETPQGGPLDLEEFDEDFLRANQCKYPEVCGKQIESEADIQRRLDILDGCKDSEIKHQIEDYIHVEVLRYLQQWLVDCAMHTTAKYAELALETLYSDYPRWYS